VPAIRTDLHTGYGGVDQRRLRRAEEAPMDYGDFPR